MATVEEMRAEFFSEQRGTTIRSVRPGRSLPRRLVDQFFDLGVGAISGIRNAGQEVLEATRSLSDSIDNSIRSELRPEVLELLGPSISSPGITLPEVPMPTTVAGNLTAGVTQFVIGFIPALRATKALAGGAAVSRAGKVGQAMAAGAIADTAVFDPHEGRLSDLVQQFPALQNPVTEYLASDPSDTEADGRFKNALEGILAGGLVDSFFHAVRGVRGIKRTRALNDEFRSARDRPRLEVETPAEVTAEVATPGRQSVPRATYKAPDPLVTPPERQGDVAGNINLERLNEPDEIIAVIRETSEQNADFVGARRGVVSNDMVNRLADDLGATPDVTLSRQLGETFNAEQILQSRRVLAASAKDLHAKAGEAVGGSDRAIAAFQQARLRHVAIQEQVAGLTAEAGRALRAFGQLVSGDDLAKATKNAIDGAGGRDSLEDLARRLNDLDPDNIGSISQFSRNTFNPTTSDKLLEFWINSLLSGPQTHAVNVLSNALVKIYTIPEHLLAAGFSALQRNPDQQIFAREIVPKLFGFVEGAKDGMRLAARTIATEEPSDFLTKLELPRARSIGGSTDSGTVAKITGRVVRIPGTLLQAEDAFFKALGYRAELRVLATRDGLNNGLRGARLAEHVRDILNDSPNVQGVAKDLRLRAQELASYETFTKELGTAGKALQKLISSHPALKLIMPFVRTPVNILKFAGERTPASLLSRTVRDNLLGRNGSEAAALQRARITFGSGVGAVAVSLAAEGVITGAGPADREARNLLMGTGWKPYAIQIDGRFYSYSRIEPLGILLGISADFADIAGHISEGESDNLGVMIGSSIANNLTNKTYLRGLSDFIGAVSDPNRNLETVLESFAGTLIPTGLAQIARVRDPVLRDAQSIIDKLKSRIPEYSKTLPPRRNLFGQQVILSGGFGPDIISPIYSSDFRPDKLIEEMVRLETVPSMPRRAINGVDLTPEQYSEFVALAGRPAKQALDQIVSSQSWDLMPDFAKSELIEEVVRDFRGSARELMLARHPELLDATIDVLTEKIRSN